MKYVFLAFIFCMSLNAHANLVAQSVNNNAIPSSGTVETDLNVESLVVQNILFKNTSSQTINPTITLSGQDASLFKISLNRCSSVGAGKTCQVSVSSLRTITPRVAAYLFTVGNLPFSISVKKNGSTNPIPDLHQIAFEVTESEISFLPTDKVKNVSFSLKNIGNKDTTAISLMWLSNNLSNSKILINRCSSGIKVGKTCSVTFSVPKVNSDITESLQASYGTSPQYSFQQIFKFKSPSLNFISRLMELDLSFGPEGKAVLAGLDTNQYFRSYLAPDGKIYGATLTYQWTQEGDYQFNISDIKVSQADYSNPSNTNLLFTLIDVSVRMNPITLTPDESGVKFSAGEILNIFSKNSKIDLLVSLAAPYNSVTNQNQGRGLAYFRYNLDGSPDLSFGQNGVKIYFWDGLFFGDNDTKRVGSKLYSYGYVRIPEPLPQDNSTESHYIGYMSVFDEDGNLHSDFNNGPWEISGQNGERSRTQISSSPDLYSQVFRPVSSSMYVHRPGMMVFESLDKELDSISGDQVPEYEPEIEDIVVKDDGTIIALVTVNKNYDNNSGGQQANRIYEIESNGHILRSVKLPQLDGTDSRTLTKDHNGNIYIEDRNYDQDYNALPSGILKLNPSLVVDNSYGINGIDIVSNLCQSLIYDNNKLLCFAYSDDYSKVVINETDLDGQNERRIEILGESIARSSRIRIQPDATILMDSEASASVIKIK